MTDKLRKWQLWGMAESEFGCGKKGEKQQNSQWPLRKIETAAKGTEIRDLGNS